MLAELAISQHGNDPPLVGPLTAGADSEWHAVLPGMTDKPPGHVRVGELDPGLAALALELLACTAQAPSA